MIVVRTCLQLHGTLLLMIKGTNSSQPLRAPVRHAEVVSATAGEVTNGTYFLLTPLAISRFSSARGLVNQPQ